MATGPAGILLVGLLADGSQGPGVYAVNATSGAIAPFGQQPGPAFGLAYDAEAELVFATTASGMRVLDKAGNFLADVSIGQAGANIFSDVVLMGGYVYVTNALKNEMYRASIAHDEATTQWSSTVEYIPFTGAMLFDHSADLLLNALSVEKTPEGALLIAAAAQRTIFRVDVATGAHAGMAFTDARRPGAPFSFAYPSAIALCAHSRKLYVLDAARGSVVVAEVDAAGLAGKVVEEVHSAGLNGPSDLLLTAESELWVANAHFGAFDVGPNITTLTVPGEFAATAQHALVELPLAAASMCHGCPETCMPVAMARRLRRARRLLFGSFCPEGCVPIVA